MTNSDHNRSAPGSRQPEPRSAGAQLALASLALGAALLLAWHIYVHLAGHVADVHSTSVVGPSGRDLWWWLGGIVSGTLAACAVLVLSWIAAALLRAPLLVLSLGANIGVAIGVIVIAGVWFPDLHQRQQIRERRVAADEFERLQRSNDATRVREEAKRVSMQQDWDDATQAMTQLDKGLVASILPDAEARSPGATRTWLRDNFGPFLESHPWQSLSDDDRAAFSAYARQILKNAARPDDSEVIHVSSMIIGAEHGLADTRGAMDECARLGAPTGRDSVASLALYLCREGEACLDGYAGLDFVRLSKDIGGAAYWSCTHTQNQHSELCAFVRHEKP